MADLKIAIAGLGTVGGGTLKLLHDQAALLAERCGRKMVVTGISARDKSRYRGVDTEKLRWFDDAVAMAREADADAIVELIGGSDGIAKAVCEAAIARGRHVVTANKALLAHHGTALARAAEAKGVNLSFEPAVAGGIPIIKAFREGLAANRIKRVYGILNGTSNFILTQMRETGSAFDTVLAEAQAQGYAEADPSFDVDGIDVAHKLSLLTSLAFGTQVDFAGVYIDGIRRISPIDIKYADELGYRIKLLGAAQETERGVEQRVSPCMVPKSVALAYVDGVFNAIMCESDFAGRSIFQGRGAGAGPTASAVVADLIDIARGHKVPSFGMPAEKLRVGKPAAMDQHVGSYYVRLMVKDQPGVIADVSAALRDENVSMESMLQRGRSETEAVPVVLTTHGTNEAAINRAVKRIAALGSVLEPPCVIRIESF